MKELLRVARRRQTAMVRLLRRLVEIESPTGKKEAVDRMARAVAREWRRRGARVRLLRQRRTGDHVRAEIRGTHRREQQLLILGHLDTVYPPGTLARMPFRISRGRAWGPGTFDMKGGLVLALFAADALRKLSLRPKRNLVFLWTSDEETGSATSRSVIEREAQKSAAVLVLEPAAGREGSLKTERKGVGKFELRVAGKNAHAGVNPSEGVNAVHELALQIERFMRWNSSRRGITVQTTVMEGGTVSNVIPDRARAEVDVRFVRRADATALQRRLHTLRPILKGAKVEVRGGISRPPLERSAKVRALFRRAQLLARKMGITLKETSTGGGSDGNFTAAMGVPTLDGLGAIGEAAHSPEECIVIPALPARAALIAGLLASL